MNHLFDNCGWRVPSVEMRVFSDKPKWYYQIVQPRINYSEILERTKTHSPIKKNLSENKFKSICEGLKNQIDQEESLRNLFCGVHIPFIAPQLQNEGDIGNELEKVSLPSVASSFKEKHPHLHCKATLQGSSKLSGEITINHTSRFEDFRDAQKKGLVVGWYFPQALQEYDIESQRRQMESLPQWKNLCLSGHSDVAAALVGSPSLLISEKNYSPVLCLSALQHNDPQLMFCFKAYGHHLEFWCMSQMLTPEVTQVSEQWTGGLTIYASAI